MLHDVCPNCGSKEVRFTDIKNDVNIWPNVKKILGDWRSMCSNCGYAWQVNADNSIATTREALKETDLTALKTSLGAETKGQVSMTGEKI